MARLANWQNNLVALIEAKKAEPFKFGTFDCSLWAMMAIEQVNGIALYERYIGTYSKPIGALKKLRQIDDVEQPIDLFKKYLGEPQPISMAKSGDVVFTSTEGLEFDLPSDIDVFGPVIGVCYGAKSIFVGEEGLIFVDTLGLDGCLWVS